MDKVTVKWGQTNWTNIERTDDTAFYAFTRGNSLLYIGIAYDQNVVDEVAQTLRRLNIKTKGVSIWLGDIDRDKSSYDRITRNIVLATECLMIYMNEPSYNTQCIQSYNHRQNFRVISNGLNLLHDRISCDSKGVFRKR